MNFLLERENFLHVCGGVSAPSLQDWAKLLFSPRMWRCFLPRSLVKQQDVIFSTYVEVFLLTLTQEDVLRDFLHVYGGVSF